MDQILNNKEHRFYHFGNNNEAFAAAWGVAGVVMTTISTAILLNAENQNLTQNLLIIVDLPVTIAFAVIFFFGYHLRRNAVMRERRGWLMAAVLNMVVSLVTTVTVVLHETTLEGVVSQMLLAIGIFALGKVAKPIVDFGIVQGFLRMPLQTSLVCHLKNHDPRVGPAIVVIAATILVVGTFWQVYFAVGEAWPIAPMHIRVPEDNNRQANNDRQLPILQTPNASPRRASHSPRRSPPLIQTNAQVIVSPRLSQSSRLSQSPRLSSSPSPSRALNNQPNAQVLRREQ